MHDRRFLWKIPALCDKIKKNTDAKIFFGGNSMNIQDQISRLSLIEKVALLQGATVWTTYGVEHAQIPSIFMADGPHGLRKQAGSGDHLGINASVPATCFPTAATMANTWNPALGEKLGKALGKEAVVNGVQVVLGPGLNIKRSPLCGRNFEYFSEDPYLSGKMAAAYIRGIQENGIAACPKHFAVNSQETRRMATDSVLDQRTLREMYLTGFEIAVKEGKAKSIMSSYNMVNGTYANESTQLLTQILRKEWGFDGFVVTDWGADNDHVAGVAAGSNVVMPAPGPDCARQLLEAVQAGRLEEKVLDQRLEELLSVIHAVTPEAKEEQVQFDSKAHHAIARQCAQESIVLLENDGILPLKQDAKVAIIGDFAKSPRYQGAGSSQVNPTQVDDLYSQITAAGVTVTAYAQGYDRCSPAPQQKLIEAAVVAAKTAETVILCVGLEEILESEGMDRLHMQLSQSQQKLIEAVCQVNQNVILVLSGGAPFVLPTCAYRAVVHGYLGGQAGAGAMVDVLLGKVNPSGKLNETWPYALADTPCDAYFAEDQRNCEYREGLFVGYRYYTSAHVPVRYPFGYGLSYTEFAYSDLVLTQQGVQFTLTNIGARDGAEVAQMYVSCPNSGIYRPQRELKGFRKVFLRAGESETVTIDFDEYTFRYFDTDAACWQQEAGVYRIQIASSATDCRLKAELTLSGVSAADRAPDCYRNAQICQVSDEDFSRLLGHPIPDGSWHGLLTKNDAICQMQYAKGGWARLVSRMLTKWKDRSEKKGKPDLNVLFIYNMPFRAMAKLAGGMVSEQMVDDILLMVNGHFFRGCGRLIRDFFRNLRYNRRYHRQLRACRQTGEEARA